MRKLTVEETDKIKDAVADCVYDILMRYKETLDIQTADLIALRTAIKVARLLTYYKLTDY